MEVNILLIFGCAVLALVVGSVWYSPLLFGNVWMRLNNMTMPTPEQQDTMRKEMMTMYLLQFALSFLQVYIFAHFVKGWMGASGIEVGLWVWLGFIAPTLAAAAMWTDEKSKDKMIRFGVQAGYNLVLFVAFGYILGVWG